MSRSSTGFCLAVILGFVGVCLACSNVTSQSEGKGERPPRSTSDSDRHSNQQADQQADQQAPAKGDGTMKSGAQVDIYGFQLGAPYKDAVAAAGQALQLTQDGPEDHRGSGTIDGMRAEVTLSGKNGRLADVHLQLRLDKADSGLADSRPFERLEAKLGKPASKSGDVAQWKPAGFEVTLQRQETYSRGEDEPKIEYSIRGRMTSAAAGSASDPGEREAKEREAEEGTP